MSVMNNKPLPQSFFATKSRLGYAEPVPLPKVPWKRPR